MSTKEDVLANIDELAYEDRLAIFESLREKLDDEKKDRADKAEKSERISTLMMKGLARLGWTQGIAIENSREHTSSEGKPNGWSFELSLVKKPFFYVDIIDMHENFWIRFGPMGFNILPDVDLLSLFRRSINCNKASFDEIFPSDWDTDKRTGFFRDVYNVALESGATLGKPFSLL